MLDSIGEKTLVADRVHGDQRAMHACGEEFRTQTRQCGRFGSSEHIWRDREIELINQAPFQQGAKKCWPAFACEPADFVFTAQRFEHRDKINLVGFSEMQRGFVFERGLSPLWHSRRGKNEDWRNGRLENLQSAVDPAFVRDDHAQWGRGLLSFDPGLLQVARNAQPNVVTFQTGMPEQNCIRQSALAK